MGRYFSAYKESHADDGDDHTGDDGRLQEKREAAAKRYYGECREARQTTDAFVVKYYTVGWD